MTSAHDPRTPLRPDIRHAHTPYTYIYDIRPLILFLVFFLYTLPRRCDVLEFARSSSARSLKGIERFFFRETSILLAPRKSAYIYIVRVHSHTHTHTHTPRRRTRNVFTTWRVLQTLIFPRGFFHPAPRSLRPTPDGYIIIIIVAGLRVHYNIIVARFVFILGFRITLFFFCHCTFASFTVDHNSQ